MTAHMDDLRSVLNQTLLQDIRKRHGIRSFLPQQDEVVSCLLDDRRERNVLYMAPAARGKTLPPLIAALEHRRQRPRRMTLWFVPTIALAHDFLKRIDRKGNYGRFLELRALRCVCFTGGEDKSNLQMEIARRGDPDVLILSPESIEKPSFIAWLMGSERNIGQIVLDEAHLFDEWGITFRRSYFLVTWLIHTLRNQNPSLKTIALSASLPEDKKKTVMRMLRFHNEDTFVSRPDALHIGPRIVCLSPRSKVAKRKALVRLLKRHLRRGERGVIFSPYKREEVRGHKLEWSVSNLYADIVPLLGLKQGQCRCYTGNEAAEERREVLSDLQDGRGKVKLLLATSAFGFGVDIRNLDFSIHVQVPEDADRLYQEISRCSRKPMSGAATVFYSPSEVGVQTRRLIGTLKSETIREYCENLGLTKIRKGRRCISMRRALRKNAKSFTNSHTAQMSADAYVGHCLETVIFLYRQNIIDIAPLENGHFPQKMSVLRTAFEEGRGSGYDKVKHGGQHVFVPAIKLPIQVLRNVTWPHIDRLVAADRHIRGNRTQILRTIGGNRTCHWRTIAKHYELGLLRKTKRGEKLVERCNYCNVCDRR